MPVIKIDCWPLDKNVKPEVIKKITKVFTDIGVPGEAVTIIINEHDKENWGKAGKQASNI
jgi:4-oxalocrotonate tautomerase